MAVDLTKPTDDGLPDERLSKALMSWALAERDGVADSTEQLAEVAAAFCAARVYVPAVEAEAGKLGLVALQRADGATAIPAFTGIEQLVGWRPEARPLPHQGADLATMASVEGYLVIVLDIDGPVTANLPVRVLTG